MSVIGTDWQRQVSGAQLIEGEWRDSSAQAGVIESWTVDGDMVCSAPIADLHTVNEAVRSAVHAFETSGWKERPGRERAAPLLRVADAMERRSAELASLLAREVGMPYELARNEEVKGAADKFRYFASIARTVEGRVTGSTPPRLLDLTVPHPVGVCALITPWNNPIEQPARQLGPALAAGCT